MKTRKKGPACLRVRSLYICRGVCLTMRLSDVSDPVSASSVKIFSAARASTDASEGAAPRVQAERVADVKQRNGRLQCRPTTRIHLTGRVILKSCTNRLQLVEHVQVRVKLPSIPRSPTYINHAFADKR